MVGVLCDCAGCGRAVDNFQPDHHDDIINLRVSGVTLLEKTLKETRPGYKEYVDLPASSSPYCRGNRRNKDIEDEIEENFPDRSGCRYRGNPECYFEWQFR